MKLLLSATLAVSAFALLAPVAARAQGGPPPGAPVRRAEEEGATIQATGRVEATPEPNMFTLVVRNMTFRVSRGTRAVLEREGVRPGDIVRISGELVSSERIMADSIQIIERARPMRAPVVIGTIRVIDRDERRISVSTPDGNVRVTWNDETEFVRNSTRSGPREFRVGDPVRVVGRHSEERGFIARRVLFGGNPGWTNGGIGEIVSLDGRGRRAEVEFEGEIWSVRLDTRNLFRDGKRLELDDLRLGTTIRVFGSARGGKSVDAERVEVIARPRDIDKR